MTFRIRASANGAVINFPDDDEGARLEEIASALCDVLDLKVVNKGGNPLEDAILLRGKCGEFVLHWDGYMTDLKPRRVRTSMIDLFSQLEMSRKFSL